MLNAGPRRRAGRHVAAVPAVVAALVAAAPASAATNQSQNQVITGTPTPQLVATFPANFTFASFAPDATATSSEQTLNIKSNASWGLRISADNANLRRWNGSAYVGGSVASPLTWAKTSEGGVPVGVPSYSAIATSTANVATGRPVTTDSGTDIGVTFRQAVSYADDASLGTDVYRAVVTYAAGQSF